MSFSDDPSSPAAPFSGDETGAIFDAPDLVLDSPTTSERVVETQSGFLVVVKRQEDRQALSVKRRLGTPPTSSVSLTADESVKLSRILGDGISSSTRRILTPRAEEYLASDSPFATIARERGRSRTVVRNSLRGVILPIFLTALLAVAIGFMTQSLRLPGQKVPVIVKTDPLDAAAIEPFVRGFVSNMLDFNPDTYKVSQIRAMAAMAPDLVESYWRDTRFPMTAKQLKALPQDTTVMINKIVPARIDTTTASTDIYAQLVNAQSKLGSPLHLKLKLSLGGDGQLRVTEQKDLTAGGQWHDR